MKISIFAEDSGTTQEGTDMPFREFYRGGFLSVSKLADQLEEYGDIQLHILTEDFGLVQGDQNVDCISQIDSENENKKRRVTKLKETIANTDVIIILLSVSTFDSLVIKNWEQIISSAKLNSIWCLGAAQNSLASIDFDVLRQKNCEVITYRRVGVARIGNDTREELVEKVEEFQSNQ